MPILPEVPATARIRRLWIRLSFSTSDHLHTLTGAGFTPAGMMPNPISKLWARRLMLFALIGLGCEQLWRHGHDYIWPEKFAVVEPGKVFRGAWQKPWPMRQIVKEHQIRTVVALAHRENEPLSVQEKALSKELGFQWHHIPIVDDRSLTDEGHLFDRLEEAAAIVADPAAQPVYFHCHHGINRASMVQIAYRTLYCNWTLDQSCDEIARTFGLEKVNKGPDYRYMTEFYARRVLPRRRGEMSPLAGQKLMPTSEETAATPGPTRR